MLTTIRTAFCCAAANTVRKVPVVLQRGAAGTMLVAGDSRWTGYLPDRFFGSAPRETEMVGRYWMWELPRVVRSLRGAADVTVVRADRMTGRMMPWMMAGGTSICVPEWVRMAAPVPSEGHRFASSQARRDISVIRRHGLGWRTSQDERELAVFIERDYWPYMRRRYGEAAYLRSRAWLRRRFANGGILWVERGGEPVAGVVFDVEKSRLRYLAVACAGADERLLGIGAVSATYLFCFEKARMLGLRTLDMRNCRPCLGDGLHAAKRKWGGRLVRPDELTHDWHVSWQPGNANAQRFLRESPLVCRDAGGYYAVTVGRDEGRERETGKGEAGGAVETEGVIRHPIESTRLG